MYMKKNILFSIIILLSIVSACNSVDSVKNTVNRRILAETGIPGATCSVNGIYYNGDSYSGSAKIEANGIVEIFSFDARKKFLGYSVNYSLDKDRFKKRVNQAVKIRGCNSIADLKHTLEGRQLDELNRIWDRYCDLQEQYRSYYPNVYSGEIYSTSAMYRVNSYVRNTLNPYLKQIGATFSIEEISEEQQWRDKQKNRKEAHDNYERVRKRR